MGINDARQSINTAGKIVKMHELVIILMRRRKFFFLDFTLLDRCFLVQSRKNNSENLTIFMGEFITKNFKKNKKKLSFLSFFFSDCTLKHLSTSRKSKKNVFDAS